MNGDYLYYSDGSGYPYDEYEYDEDYDEFYCDVEGYYCEAADCGEVAYDECQCCGKPLCFMHNEIGRGFCRDCPTQDWIDQQLLKDRNIQKKLKEYI